MSKKDYIKFAEMFKEQAEQATDLTVLATIKKIADNAADIFKADNPNFDQSRFMEASGLK